MSNPINVKLLDEILKKFKINRKNLSIYVEALTHPTFSHENNLKYSYQKLEFLGDATISWVISKYLYNLEKYDESQMSQYKSNIVKGSVLAEYAKSEFMLDRLVLKGKGLVVITDKILEDLFESFIGAIYKDQGFRKAEYVIHETLIKHFLTNKINIEKSYKTKIQEYFMKSESDKSNAINYKATQQTDGSWNVVLIFDKNVYGEGKAKTKKEAEELAAKQAYEKCVVLN